MPLTFVTFPSFVSIPTFCLSTVSVNGELADVFQDNKGRKPPLWRPCLMP